MAESPQNRPEEPGNSFQKEPVPGEPQNFETKESAWFSEPSWSSQNPPSPPPAPSADNRGWGNPAYPPYGETPAPPQGWGERGTFPPAPPYGGYPNGAPPPSAPYNYYRQQAPGYMPPPYPPAVRPNQPGEGLALVSLIVGILSLMISFIPLLGSAAALGGLIPGILARIKGYRGGMSLAGIILSALALAVSLIITVAAVVAVFYRRDYFNSAELYDYYRSMGAAVFLLLQSL